MTARLYGIILAIFCLAGTARAATASGEPFMVEAKVQADLENALSRVVPREQFLVQVNTDVGTRVERRLIEGETVTIKPEPTRPPVMIMPGFLPEPDLEKPQAPPQQRELYRLVETPELKAVMVHVSFDTSVEADLLNRGKKLVTDYMQQTYPGKAVMTFSQIPMLKKKPEEDRDVASDEEESPEEKIWNYARWGILALLGLAVLMLWTRQTAMAYGNNRGGGAKRRSPGNPWDSEGLTPPGPRAALEGMNRALNNFARLGAPASAADHSPEAAEHMLEVHRRKLLNKFLLKSEAFRLYYSRLDDEGKSELYAALNGPAFESLLDGLGLPKVPSEESDATRLEERVAHHEKHFEEFAAAKEWQDRQFFGFLQQLNDEQLATLVSHETPLAAALMLRHMRANQSASVLDSLTPERRVEVLASVKELQEIPLSKMAAIEKEVRQAAQKVPQHTLGGTPQEDINFWGHILTESRDQDSLFDDLEKTNPHIAPQLKKYKFKLEDAATLPNNLLERIIGEVDNDELGLALATVPADVAEVILDAVSARRRDLLMSQLDTYRGAPPEQTQAARSKLTKRFRDALK